MTVTGQGVSSLPRDLAASPRLCRWITVLDDGTIGLRVGKVELGQGILTAVAQVAADELDVPLEQIRMLPAHTAMGPDQGLTAGSTSVSDALPCVQIAAANVRSLFVDAAARDWGADPAAVTVRRGIFRHRGTASTTSYGALAGTVDLAVEATADVTVKPARVHDLVGSSTPRLDLPDKVAGRPRFIGDLRLPGMLFGRVVRPPSPTARLVAVELSRLGDSEARLVRDGSFLGVVDGSEREADRAAELTRAAAVWAEEDLLPDEDGLAEFLIAGPHETVEVLDDRRPAAPTGRRLRARYSRPFLAHASIGTSTAIAHWDPDGRAVSVRSHSQGIHRLRGAIAQALNLDPAAVTVEHVEHAGCYGHNGADDAAFDAVLLARAVPGHPVMLRWSRADELAWSPFGSAMVSEVEAHVDDAGRIVAWDYDVYSQGHASRPPYAGVPGLLAASHLAAPWPAPAALEPPPAAGGGTARNAVPIYVVGARRVAVHRLVETPIRSSALRSLGAHMNVFSIESFMDEAAASCGADPLAYRLRHLEDERAREVLVTAATAAGWGGDVEEGVGRGLGLARYKERGAYCAVVAEVEAEDRVVVRRLTLAVDVGRVVNPDGVRNQIEGGAIQATSWTLKERVRFDRRRITSTDWESYPILRFSESPEIDVHLVDRPDCPPVGSGEAAQGPTAAAIGNAVAALVGVRVRDLPITAAGIVAAIEARPD